MSLRVVPVAVLLCLPATVTAQDRFEGVVTAAMSAVGARGGMATYAVKGDRLRMDMTGETGTQITVLHDRSKALNVMLVHERKMVLDVTSMQGAKAAAAAKKPTMTLTGKKETIAGRECEHALVKSDDGSQLDVCLAKGMGEFVMGSGSAGGSSPALASTSEVLSKLGADAFPLKVMDVKTGAVVFLVRKIEKRSLDDALFAIPDGYQKIDMRRLGRPGL